MNTIPIVMSHREGQYSERLLRDRPRLGRFQGVLIGWLPLFLISSQAIAQEEPVFDHPLFTSPIREADPSPIDIRHLSIDVSINPVEHTVAGRLVATFRRVVLEPIRIAVSSDSAAVQRSILRGPGLEGETEFEWEDGKAFLLLPEQAVASASDYYFSTELDRSESFGSFPLGIESGPWSSVWTSSEPGGDHWLPFTLPVDDWFTVDMRVSAPGDWVVFLPGTISPSIRTANRAIRRTALLSAGPVTRIGFAATEGTSVAEAPEWASLDAKLTGDRLKTLVAMVTEIREFIDGRTNVEEDPSRSPFLQGLIHGDTSDFRLSLLPVSINSSELDAIRRDHEIAATVARTWMLSELPPSGWTDIWVQEALAEFLALEYIREEHGELGYLDQLWSLRQRYLEEFRLYQRPLVWDRWEHPVDMLDEHARGKGAWIIHMLAGRFGPETIFEAIRLLATMGRERTIGTEELRYALESGSRSDLTEFFDQWVYGSGHPVLDFQYSVGQDQTEIELAVFQKQSGHLVPSSFTFDLDVEASSLAGIDSSRLNISDESTSATMPVTLRPQYVRLDPEGEILFEFTRPVEASDLVSALRRARSDASRFLAVAMLRETDVEPSLLLGMRPVLSIQLPEILRRDLLEVLGNLAPSSSALRVILPAVSDSSGLIRAAAISALGSFSRAPEARQAVFDAANSEQNPLVLAAAVRSLVQLDPPLAWTLLRSAMVTESEQDIVRRTAIPLVVNANADGGDKRDLLRPLLEPVVETETRAVAVSALCTWIEDEDLLRELLSFWPTAEVRLRSAILDCIEIPAARPFLYESGTGLLKAWSSFEPDPLLLRRIGRLLTDTAS